jgi:hypothetical protein
MKQIWLKSAAVVAGVWMGSIGSVAQADDVVAPAGAKILLNAYQPKTITWADNASSHYPMEPFAKDNQNFCETGSIWVDAGSARKLTGAKFCPRAAGTNQGIRDRWVKFRVWGADVPGPYTSTEGMELVMSNYWGAAVNEGSWENVLTNYEGIAAHRYYYFDNYNGVFNFQIELYSEAPCVTWDVLTEVSAAEGNYTFSGKVAYAPTADGVEICVAVAKENCDADYAAWAEKGKIYKAEGTYVTDGTFEIVAKGIASGRTYAKLFYRAAGETDWMAAPGWREFAAHGSLATPVAYMYDSSDPSSGGYPSMRMYDGSTSGFAEASARQIIFKLDPSLDYAALRVYARLDCRYQCWIRSHYVKGLYVAKPSEEPDWSGAVKVNAVTARELYWYSSTDDIPALDWVELPVASDTIKHENQGMSYYDTADLDDHFDVILDKKLMSGAKYLKLDLATTLNTREIQLYTVKKESFCIRIQ